MRKPWSLFKQIQAVSISILHKKGAEKLSRGKFLRCPKHPPVECPALEFINRNRVEKISHGDHAHELSGFRHCQVARCMPLHQVGGFRQGRSLLDLNDREAHNLFDVNECGVALRAYHIPHDIRFRHNADNPALQPNKDTAIFLCRIILAACTTETPYGTLTTSRFMISLTVTMLSLLSRVIYVAEFVLPGLQAGHTVITSL